MEGEDDDEEEELAWGFESFGIEKAFVLSCSKTYWNIEDKVSSYANWKAGRLTNEKV